MDLLNKVIIPGWLYYCWPWLVLGMAGVFIAIGLPWIAWPMVFYAAWVLIRRNWR